MSHISTILEQALGELRNGLGSQNSLNLRDVTASLALSLHPFINVLQTLLLATGFSSLSKKDAEMDILEVIKNDHDRVRALLARLVNNQDSAAEKRTDIIRRIRDEVIPHARAEESVLYNGMRSEDGPTDLVYHGFKEHAEIDVLLRALEAVDNYNTKGWSMLAEKLQEELNHHMEEEEAELFPEVRATFDKTELEDMAIRFKELKPQIREEGVLKNSLDFVANLIPPHMIEQIKERVPDMLKLSTDHLKQ